MNRYSATWFELFLESVQPVQTESEIAFITRHLPNPPYSAVLDLCCGQGRHARLLARRNYQVTGIDLNTTALDKARRQSNGKVIYLEMDMRHLTDLPNSFDTIINLWQSFGYFDETTNTDILRQISQKLNRQGRFILDIYHRGFFEQHQGTWQVERNGTVITETELMTGKRLTVELKYSHREIERFDWRLYTPDEICLQAKQYDLEPQVICTGFDEGQSISVDSPRMQLVFEKAKV